MSLITGDNDNNVLVGTDNNDIMRGYGAQDQMVGILGNDYINGGDGNDELIGGFGDDTILGGQGQDNGFFFRGDDVIIGGEGQDVFEAYFIGSTPAANDPRGSTIFKYDDADGRDTIFGFDPAFDVILIPEGIEFTVEERVNKTRVEFGSTIVDLENCFCANEVQVVFDEDQIVVNPPDDGDDNNNNNNNEGNDGLIIAASVASPLILLAFILVVLYRRRSDSIGSRFSSSGDRDATGHRSKPVVSNWFYLMYGQSIRTSQAPRESQLPDDQPSAARLQTYKGPRPTNEERPQVKKEKRKRKRRKQKLGLEDIV